jgi:predicted cupin superfamily sugar epimerase
VVPGGYWKGTRLTDGELGLVGEAAAPGWDPRDRDFATEADLAAWSADVAREVRPLLRKP